jgi:hypothetical protein
MLFTVAWLALGALPVQIALSDARDAAAPEVQLRVEQAFAAGGLAVVSGAALAARVSECAGRPECLSGAAREGAVLLVTLDVGHVSDLLVGHLEARDGSTWSATADFAVKRSRWREELPAAIAAFVEEVHAHVPPTPEAPVALPVPAPAPVLERPRAAPPATTVRRRVLPVSLAGGAVVAAIGSFSLAMVGVGDVNRFHQMTYVLDGEYASRLSQSELDGLAGRANTELTVAFFGALVAVALAGLAIALW